MYPQSNGFAESMVKVMKNLIIKAISSNEDPHWALLAYRATPHSASLAAPAQMLHGRPLRTNLPSPRPAAQSDDTLVAQSCRQQSYAQATSSKQLSPLQEGQSVTMYNHNTHTWKPATVTQMLQSPGLISYQQLIVVLIVEIGVIFVLLRQQRLIVLHHHITQIVYTQSECTLHTPSGCNSCGSNVTQPQNGSIHDGQYVTRYGRISKQPPDISRDIGYEH